MGNKKDWFGRPVASLCVCSAAIIIALLLPSLRGPAREQKNTSYMITLAIHGTDARDMERIAAIPLEDALSGLPDINRILTFSENSRVRAFVNLSRDNSGSYGALREAVQRVYENMPPWAQRPELSSSSDSRIPVWTAAVAGGISGDYLEKVIKPALEGLEGTGEVEISETGVTEILVVPDEEKTALLGLSASAIAAALSANDGIFPGGKFKFEEREIPVKIDGRYADSAALGEAWINMDSGKAILLKDIASVIEREKEETVLSRLDGIKTPVISIQAASGADLAALSRRVRKELEKFTMGKIHPGQNSAAGINSSAKFIVLRDLGAEEEKAFFSVLAATAEAAVLVALCAALLAGKNRGPASVVVCALSIPFIAVVSSGALSWFGLAVNRKLLAGLSIGIGAAADAVILCAEGFGKQNNSGSVKETMTKLLPPLVSGAATTIAALFPLARFSEVEDMSVITWALGTVTLVSLAASLTVLPPLFLIEDKRKHNNTKLNEKHPSRIKNLLRKFLKKLFIKGKRLLAAGLKLCLDKPLLSPALALIAVLLGTAALFSAGVDISEHGTGNSIYARVEFEGGFHREKADELIITWTNELKKHEGIVSIQSSVRTGSAQALVNFDPKKIPESKARELIRSNRIPGGFIHIPEAVSGEHSWEITISGDNDEQCRKLVEEAAFLCSSLNEVRETILNFKTGNPRLTLVPKRELLTKEGFRFSETADTLRNAIHGKVIYKRPGEKGETDVRVKLASGSYLTPEEALAIPAINPRRASNNGISEIKTQFIQYRDNEPSVIQRENRRRTASFSIRTPVMDPRKIRDKICKAAEALKLPPGYTMEFDRDAIVKAEAMTGTIFRFLLALVFCYMVISAANESLRLPLIVLSSVPPSLAVPVLILVLSGSAINSAVCCSLVAVSGITVNAAVIVTGEFSTAIKSGNLRETQIYYNLIRRRLPCLLAVCGTTMAGAMPFLFLRDTYNSMIRILSIVTFTGVGVSLLTSVTLIPSLIKMIYTPEQTKPKAGKINNSEASSDLWSGGVLNPSTRIKEISI